MKPSTKYIVFIVSFFVTFSFIFKALSDDDHYKKRYRYRGGQKIDDDRNDHDNNDHLKPVTNQSYKDTCGECHFAYQPGLLPSVSWLKILNQLDNHFGEEIEIDPVTIKNISDYLITNSAENSSVDDPKEKMLGANILMNHYRKGWGHEHQHKGCLTEIFMIRIDIDTDTVTENKSEDKHMDIDVESFEERERGFL